MSPLAPSPPAPDEAPAAPTTPPEGGATPPVSDPPPHPDEVPADDDGRMSLMGHLEELRARLIRSLLWLCGGLALTWTFSDRILALVTRLSPDHKFVFLSPSEAFFTQLSVAFWAAVLITAPIHTIEAWAFLRPALTVRERTASRFLFPFVTLFFALGAGFAYFVMIPIGLRYLLSFATPDLQPMLSIGDFATFVLTFLLVFGLAFELPVGLWMAAKLGLVARKDLELFRGHFVVGASVVAAIFTPPDVVSQIMLFLPLWGLYELTIAFLKMTGQ